MKIATSTSHALTLLAVVLLAATLLMDAAEARRGGHRPKTLIETFERCLCGDIDTETDCSICFDPVRDNPDTATWDNVFSCLDTAGIDSDPIQECARRNPCSDSR
ncbi:uncharacterized protein LOC123518204 [Portunus trituberculatus]|uniref:uncharacterized protein LOC123518204 n=1 Tax=Portunus trituberculatus TaxID=210409 RepID=UPI001E1D0949|nr:uncharacterized protein LOC123518204 [Portunus trituberculatus]